MDNNLKKYSLIIKREKVGYYSNYSARLKRIRESDEKFKNSYIKIVNKVVELGGVIDVNRRQLEGGLHSSYMRNIIIHISESDYKEVAKMDEVTSLTEAS